MRWRTALTFSGCGSGNRMRSAILDLQKCGSSSLRVSVMLLAPSCGDPVQPPAQANEDAGGPVDVPDPVQQPPPATQRPRVGQMPDRLLHQRAQPRLHAVERPLRVAEPVFGPAV